MSEEALKQISEAIYILERIIEDNSIPRNIRRAAQQSIDILNDESMDLQVRAVNVIELLEDSTADPNCPLHARTMIFQIITRLELPQGDDEDDYYYEDEDEEE